MRNVDMHYKKHTLKNGLRIILAPMQEMSILDKVLFS